MNNEYVVNCKARIDKWMRARSLIGNMFFKQTDLFDDVEIPEMYKQALNDAMVAIDFRIDYWKDALDDDEEEAF